MLRVESLSRDGWVDLEHREFFTPHSRSCRCPDCETLDLMFEPLRRGGTSPGESEQGSLGLGLFVVKQIVQAHGGTVCAESSNGMTTFTLHLPGT